MGGMFVSSWIWLRLRTTSDEVMIVMEKKEGEDGDGEDMEDELR